jgi:hypothetical protein
MDIVRDGSGTEFLRLERSAESSRVRDPRTDEELELPNGEIESSEASALSVAGWAVPEAIREELGTVGDDRTLGLLWEISGRDPIGVRVLLDEYDLCESELHGMVGELRAAGLIEPAEPAALNPIAASDRGYRTTERARSAFARHRAEPGERDVDIEDQVEND